MGHAHTLAEAEVTPKHSTRPDALPGPSSRTTPAELTAPRSPQQPSHSGTDPRDRPAAPKGAHKGPRRGRVSTERTPPPPRAVPRSQAGSGAPWVRNTALWEGRGGEAEAQGARMAAYSPEEVAVGEGAASAPANGPTERRGGRVGHEGRFVLCGAAPKRRGAVRCGRRCWTRSRAAGMRDEAAGAAGRPSQLSSEPSDSAGRAERSFSPCPSGAPRPAAPARSGPAPPFAPPPGAPQPPPPGWRRPRSAPTAGSLRHRRAQPGAARAPPGRAERAEPKGGGAARPPRPRSGPDGAAALGPQRGPTPPPGSPPPRPAAPRSEPPPRSPRGPYRRRSAPGRSRPLSVAVPCGPGGGRRRGRPHSRPAGPAAARPIAPRRARSPPIGASAGWGGGAKGGRGSGGAAVTAQWGWVRREGRGERAGTGGRAEGRGGDGGGVCSGDRGDSSSGGAAGCRNRRTVKLVES